MLRGTPQISRNSSLRLLLLLLVLACHSTLSLSSSIVQSSRTDRTRRWLQQQQAQLTSATTDTSVVATTSESKQSVHMQLNPSPLAATATAATEHQTNPSEPSPSKDKDNTKSTTFITVHSFVDLTGKQWRALNTTKRKFLAFLNYNRVEALLSQIETTRYASHKATTTRQEPGTCQIGSSSNTDDESEKSVAHQRQDWRRLWKSGRLLTDRTELLAVYPSDNVDSGSKNDSNDSLSINEQQLSSSSATPSRGGFTDLLGLYTDRVAAILQDEREQQQGTASHDSLLTWLQRHYGYRETMRLMNDEYITRQSQDERKANWKHFLEWFRQEFPYYYDRCESCGASVKEMSSQKPTEAKDIERADAVDDKHDFHDDDADDHPTFIGYIYPSFLELDGKASRTELYRCHACTCFTRFPRYNSASHVLNSRRGRCGEYSMLLFRFLRALNYHCRWVVDWADHVWAEVAMESDDGSGRTRWVHLDPCEAAVDENLLYEGWGKRQTYILAFYAPPMVGRGSMWSLNGLQTYRSSAEFPLIEDVTQSYTSDSWSEICKRRDEDPEHVRTAITRATAELQSKLAGYYHVD